MNIEKFTVIITCKYRKEKVHVSEMQFYPDGSYSVLTLQEYPGMVADSEHITELQMEALRNGLRLCFIPLSNK